MSQQIIRWLKNNPGYHYPGEVAIAFGWLDAMRKQEMSIRLAGLWTRRKIVRGGRSGLFCYAQASESHEFPCPACGVMVRPIAAEREVGRALCIGCYSITQLKTGECAYRWDMRINRLTGRVEPIRILFGEKQKI